MISQLGTDLILHCIISIQVRGYGGGKLWILSTEQYVSKTVQVSVLLFWLQFQLNPSSA
jgi:hypothetical protein